jgi:hypothetical protein
MLIERLEFDETDTLLSATQGRLKAYARENGQDFLFCRNVCPFDVDMLNQKRIL